MASPTPQWIDPKFGTAHVHALALDLVERDGAAVLRGRGTRCRRTLAAVAAGLPEGIEAYRIPEPSADDVTTLVVHRAGVTVGWWEDNSGLHRPD